MKVSRREERIVNKKGSTLSRRVLTVIRIKRSDLTMSKRGTTVSSRGSTVRCSDLPFSQI